jgi:hypothetical protein
MKLYTRILLGLAAVGILLVSPAARAEFLVGDFSGDNLVRRNVNVPNGQWVTVQTLDCDTGEDTVLFLLEGALNGTAPKTTRGYSDDFNGTSCSYIAFKNTTGSAKDYTIIATTYEPASPATVRLLIQLTPNPRTEETVVVGGLVYRTTGNSTAETVQTVPVRGSNGGKPVDTVLYVINPTLGGAVKFDDDSGLQVLSKIQQNIDCSNVLCWVVAGNYFYGNSGGNLMVWSQNTANDTDQDGISNNIELGLIAKGRLPSGADTKKDSDNDGLSDFVELVGVPAASLAGPDASLAMPWQGSIGGPDPAIEDLFVEIDWMEDTSAGSAHSHKPYTNLASELTSIFSSDNAWTGRNIRVHTDVSQNVGHWNNISYVTCGAGDVNFYTIKNNSAFFDPLRRLTHHYVIAAHFEKDSACTASTISGRAEILGNDVYITLGLNTGFDMTRGTYVHETGHNLFLDHNSNDNPSTTDESCVHSSVMNYRYQFGGWNNSGNTLRSFGYSNGSCLSGNTGGSCANTCTNRCVTAGQVTPKLSCPFGTGANATKHVSNGTCDCDLTEWASPGALPVAYKVSLAFQSGAASANGVPTAAGEGEALAEYHQGGMGALKAMRSLHRKVADRKRLFVEKQGMLEGRDFVVNPENGKIYSGR